MKLKKIAFTLLVLVFASSCTRQRWTSLTISERLLSFPSGYYDHVLYIDRQIVGFRFDSDAQIKNQVSFAFEGDTETIPFRPGDDPECRKYTKFEVVTLLPDGRLGLFKECKVDTDLTPYRTVFAYDWHTGDLEQLVPGRLDLFGPKAYIWNPDMTLGIQEISGSYRGTIYWITHDGTSPMDIEIEDRGLTWNLRDYLDGKTGTGLVGSPSWSSNGKTIAFFVSTYGILEEPSPKFNVNYDLFFMDPVILEPKLELRDIADADKIVWSPDNEYLLFRGCIRNAFTFTCGLWRYRIADKELFLIKEGDFADYIWITDEKIVAANNIYLPYRDNKVWEYTIIE